MTSGRWLNSIPGVTLGINYTVQTQELVKLDIILDIRTLTYVP